jgi:NAD(P)H-hydrate repair Nnr-like enzyme with NAD(P)H-hydrate epimerase domain
VLRKLKHTWWLVPTSSRPVGRLCVLDGVGAQGGDGFDVARHQLDGGEVVGVAGEPFDREPGSGNSVTVDR